MSVHGPPGLCCEPLKLPNFDLNADSDPAFHFNTVVCFFEELEANFFEILYKKLNFFTFGTPQKFEHSVLLNFVSRKFCDHLNPWCMLQ